MPVYLEDYQKKSPWHGQDPWYETGTHRGGIPTNFQMKIRRLQLEERERDFEIDRTRQCLKWLASKSPVEAKAVAEFSAYLAALELRIETPIIKEMSESDIHSKPNWNGYAFRGEENITFIRLARCAHEIIRTSAHETRHRWQTMSGGYQGSDEEREKDAEGYAADFMKKLRPLECLCGEGV